MHLVNTLFSEKTKQNSMTKFGAELEIAIKSIINKFSAKIAELPFFVIKE